MRGLNYDELFPGRFMKAGEFKGRAVTLTIKDIDTEALPQDQGGEKVRGIISFTETKKQLVLNRTNGECLKALFGAAVDDWFGKRVTLFPSEWNGEPAIRVKGSPHITAPMEIEVKLPRRRPIPMTLVPTGKAAPPAAQREPAAESGDDDEAKAAAFEREVIGES